MKNALVLATLLASGVAFAEGAPTPKEQPATQAPAAPAAPADHAPAAAAAGGKEASEHKGEHGKKKHKEKKGAAATKDTEANKG